jgi:hypothetical protein
MEVSDQCHTQAALPAAKGPRYPLDAEVMLRTRQAAPAIIQSWRCQSPILQIIHKGPIRSKCRLLSPVEDNILHMLQIDVSVISMTLIRLQNNSQSNVRTKATSTPTDKVKHVKIRYESVCGYPSGWILTNAYFLTSNAMKLIADIITLSVNCNQ